MTVQSTISRRSEVPQPSAGVAQRGLWTVALMRRVGLVVLALQLVGMAMWSSVLAGRYALTIDFTTYHQAWWLIGHGTFNPYDTGQGFPFWQGHGEFLLWPLALVGDLWPHPVTMLWVQDLALVGAEMVAFVWMCEVVETSTLERRHRHLAPGLAALGVILLVANPWIYWSASWDFHAEPVGVLFLLLGAHELWRHPQSRRVWIWVVLAMACGDVVTTYVVGIGLSAVIAGRAWRRRGAQVVVASVVWAFIVSVVLGAHKAAGLGGGYGYLVAGGGAAPASVGLIQLVKGILTHPGTVVRVLWGRQLDLYAAIAAGGFFGAFWPWVLIPTFIVLLENGLNGHGLLFISPSFQDVLVYVLVPVGTVALLVALARRHALAAVSLGVLVGLNALGWGAVWLPQTVSHWLRVSPGAAATLNSVAAEIPSHDEVVVSEGVSGGFSGRTWVYPIGQSGSYPVHTSVVWVVIAPSQGVEEASVKVESAWVSEMAGPLHAQLVTHANGIWAFRWAPPPGTSQLVIPSTVPTVTAWSVSGPSATVVTTGPSADWRAEANGTAGYVVDGDYWQEQAGRYQATATLSTSVDVDVEVWNATDEKLLARRQVPPTDGMVAVSMPVDLSELAQQSLYQGVGPFRIQPVQPAPGNQLEIRVWTPGGGLVSVASLELVRAR